MEKQKNMMPSVARGYSGVILLFCLISIIVEDGAFVEGSCKPLADKNTMLSDWHIFDPRLYLYNYMRSQQHS